MKNFYTLLFLILLSKHSVAQRLSGKYKGDEKISKEISLKIFNNIHDYQNVYFLGQDKGLTKFLGHMAGFGVNFRDENSVPNSLNFSLYYLIFSQLADKVAKICQKQDHINVEYKQYGALKSKNIFFRTSFQKNMIQICSWPNKKRKVKRGMQEIWNDLTAYSSNEKSYYQIEKFMFENYQKKTNQEFVKDFLLNVLLNPFFLLER